MSSRRRGTSLLHTQAAIAIASVLIATGAVALSGLYRMQQSAENMRQKEAMGYRFEQQFRQDAAIAQSAKQIAANRIAFLTSKGEVTYEISENRVIRSLPRGDQIIHEVLFTLPDSQAELKLDEEKQITTLRIRAGEGKGYSDYRVETPVGTLHELSSAGREATP